MAELDNIYHITEGCYMDSEGVYKEGQRVSLDNTYQNGYIRRTDKRSLSGQEGCGGLLDSELPLRFVGVVPNGDIDKVERATIAAILSGVNIITYSDTDKLSIAEAEGIDIEDLTKFDGCVLIAVDYIETKKIEYDPRCDYDLC